MNVSPINSFMESQKVFVYLITNKINGKKYVGQHSGDDLKQYWNHCVRAALRGRQDKPHLYNAVRKYGVENFEVEPLVVVNSKQEMDKYEIGLIRALDTRRPNGYNLTDGGDGQLGRIPSEKTRRKISETKKSQKLHHSEDTKQRLRKAMLGFKHSEESKEKISEYRKTEEQRKRISAAKMGNTSRLGMKHSEETKKRMSEAAKGRKFSEEHKRNLSLAHQRRRLAKGIQ